MAADTLFSKFPNIINSVIKLQKKSNNFDTLCELGSGSGQVLRYLAERINTINNFIGIDLSPETVAECQEKYANNKMQFIAADGNKWIRSHAKPQWLYVSHGGVLEYFPEDVLFNLFCYLSSHCAPCGFLLLEPRGVNHDVAQSSQSEPYSNEYSFSHHYEHLLTKAGFKIHSAEIQPFSNQCHFICILASCGIDSD
jgi:trans-aconitate methyltransferase